MSRLSIELILGRTDEERSDERRVLCSPDAGVFTDAAGRGAALAPGQPAGTLLRLGRAVTLVVPKAGGGTVVSARPERVHEPVGCGAVLYEIVPFSEARESADAGDAEAQTGADGLFLPAPQSGRFYRRPAPGEPEFVGPGDVLEEGVAVGLIEVMKTFTQVVYRPAEGLPERARVVRLVAADGADVAGGESLIELEPG